MHLIDNIKISCLDPSQHSQTCGYWYTVQNNGTAHTAFARLSSLKRWLEERELKPIDPFPEKNGTPAFIRVEGQYVQSLLMCSEQEWDAIKPIGESIGLQNGNYVEVKFTRDEAGNVVENKLNPNCLWRRTFDTTEPELELRFASPDCKAVASLWDAGHRPYWDYSASYAEFNRWRLGEFEVGGSTSQRPKTLLQCLEYVRA
jgi:hypothetical protein